MHPRLYRVLESHQRIDEKLRREQRRSSPDSLQLVRLKKLKLRIKNMIHRFLRTPSRI